MRKSQFGNSIKTCSSRKCSLRMMSLRPSPQDNWITSYSSCKQFEFFPCFKVVFHVVPFFTRDQIFAPVFRSFLLPDIESPMWRHIVESWSTMVYHHVDQDVAGNEVIWDLPHRRAFCAPQFPVDILCPHKNHHMLSDSRGQVVASTLLFSTFLSQVWLFTWIIFQKAGHIYQLFQMLPNYGKWERMVMATNKLHLVPLLFCRLYLLQWTITHTHRTTYCLWCLFCL